MKSNFNIGEYVEITSQNVRTGHKGKIVNILGSENTIYAVEFGDGCTGFFKAYEMKEGNTDILSSESEIWGNNEP